MRRGCAKWPNGRCCDPVSCRPVRDSLIAVPGNGVENGAGDRSTKVVSDLGERISATVNKIGEGLRNAFAKPGKAASADAETRGTGSTSAGAGSSGDSK
jgi:hypothetical protein